MINAAAACGAGAAYEITVSVFETLPVKGADCDGGRINTPAFLAIFIG
jgi:hypothetical protein